MKNPWSILVFKFIKIKQWYSYYLLFTIIILAFDLGKNIVGQVTFKILKTSRLTLTKTLAIIIMIKL